MHFIYRVFLYLLMSLYSLTISAQGQEYGGTAQPADVLVVVQTIASEIKTLREIMGKQEVALNRFQVEFAAPRHVYYQAQTMFRKINRLGTEIGGITRQSPPPAPDLETEIMPDDVLRVVNLAQNQLSLISDNLGIEYENTRSERKARTTPKDVLEATVEINRQVNLMIDEPFRPVDVYERLSSISAHLAGVLVPMGKEPFPKVDFVPRKRPVDVYSMIIDCLVLNQSIGQKLNAPVLKINPRVLRRNRSTLSDNYDLATMLVSDITFWSRNMNFDEDVFPDEEVLRNIFPAHVFQKASVIRQQLNSINNSL